MEIIGAIFLVVGILLVLGSLALCFSGNFWGVFGTVIGCTLLGVGEFVHIGDEAKLKLATETYKKNGELLIIKTYQESLGPIYDAAMEISANTDKIQQVYNELEKKSNNVSSEESKKIFRNKLDQLTRQKNKLKASLQKLESCAFEQVLVKHMENTPEAAVTGLDVASNIKDELDAVRKIMQEVEKINQN